MYARDVDDTPDRGSAGELPEWYMPPRMIGGYVAGPVLMGRSDGLVVMVRQVVAYPAGLEVEIEAHARGPAPGGPPPDPGAGSLGGHVDLNFRLRLADGRDVAQDDEAGLRSGRGPMLVVSRSESSSGGPGDREDVRLTLWIWSPAPRTPGPLTVVCSWPRRGLREAGLVLEADAIEAAALRARPFWTEGS
jgi:hypothetical protein